MNEPEFVTVKACKDNRKPLMTEDGCKHRHGATRRVLGGLSALGLAVVTFMAGAVKLSYDGHSKIDAEIQRSTTVDNSQEDVLHEIQTDVRETRNDVKAILRDGRHE